MEDQWGEAETMAFFYYEQGKLSSIPSSIDFLEHHPSLRVRLLYAKILIARGQLTECVEFLKKLERDGYEIPEVISLRGRSLYSLGEFDSALACFQRSEAICPSAEITRCIERCKARIAASTDDFSRRVIKFEPPFSLAFPSEWHQTDTHVFASFSLKNVPPNQIKIQFSEKSADITISCRGAPPIHIDLLREIVTADSSFTIDQKSIELKMKKAVEENWDTLEPA